jgi:hypothetical protein
MAKETESITDLTMAYAKLSLQSAEINGALKELELRISDYVASNGDVAMHGVSGKVVEGRRDFAHEKACIDANVPAALVAKHTKIVPAKESISWAAITKEAKLDMSGYVTQGPSKIVVAFG